MKKQKKQVDQKMLVELIREKLDKKLESKGNWRKNSVMMAFDQAVASATLEILERTQGTASAGGVSHTKDLCG